MSEPGHYTTNVSDMYAVHRALTDALDAAPARVTAAGSDAARVEVIGSFYDNVLEFLHVHHQGEDELLYPLLEQRCGHERRILERIDDQHKLLYEPMDVARATLAAWRHEPSDANARSVVDALENIDSTLRPHLNEEEETVLPIATKWISQDEWHQLPGHAMASFSGDKPWLVIGLLLDELDEVHREMMLGAMPSEVGDLWREQWSPAFNDFMSQVRA